MMGFFNNAEFVRHSKTISSKVALHHYIS